MNKDTKTKFTIEYFEGTSKKGNIYKGYKIHALDKNNKPYYITSIFINEQQESIIDLVSNTFNN